jgi:GNAT superfamily N-acetyltransferase
VKIEYLADCPQDVPQLAAWFHAQWSYLCPELGLEERTERLRGRVNRADLPLAVVARVNGCPVGSASLVACDMHTRRQLTPWLSSVYVDAPFRRQGIGAALVRRVLDEAHRLGVGTVYLWTPDREAFYSKRGWVVEERVNFRGVPAVLMSSAASRRGASRRKP